MRLVTWSFQSLQIPMIETEDGSMFCTSGALCSALGLTTAQLRKVRERHKDRLQPSCVTDCHAARFIQDHLASFGLNHVRGDMLLWSLDTALGVAFHVHTSTAWAFHQAAIKLIKEHATREVVPLSKYEELLQRVERLEQITLDSREALRVAASAAGATLNAHKEALHSTLLN